MAPDLTILGAGSWGTALAIHLARSGRSVALWAHDPALADSLNRERTNTRYLPARAIPVSVRITAEIDEALDGASDVLLVVPSHHCRRVLTDCLPHVTSAMSFCSASKGIESDTLMTVTQVMGEVFGEDVAGRTAALSGPSFADEVAAGHPTAVVVASSDPGLAARLQAKISSGILRVYTHTDVIGVELGGSLKNVIAIGAGAVEGIGYGANTLAALITRGLAEMSRLTQEVGGRRETLAGLAGLGDLVLTCTGKLSRNRALGQALAKGLTLAEHQATTPTVAEGVRTTLSAHRLSQRHGVEMPITRQVHAVLYEGRTPAEAIEDLLARHLTTEGP